MFLNIDMRLVHHYPIVKSKWPSEFKYKDRTMLQNFLNNVMIESLLNLESFVLYMSNHGLIR